MQVRTFINPGLAFGVCAWSVMLGAGFYFVAKYENTPAHVEAPPLHWPANCSFAPVPNRMNLVMAVHPHCPCTRATIDELTELMAHPCDRFVVHVLVFKPKHAESGWEQTEIWHRAAALPSVRVRSDEDGVEAKRFGMTASGHAVLFDSEGHALFSGGLTNARGHAGDSVGRRAILAFLTDAIPETTTTPVFGCSLATPETRLTERCKQCPN
jgi:hypothetical protein